MGTFRELFYLQKFLWKSTLYLNNTAAFQSRDFKKGNITRLQEKKLGHFPMNYFK